MSEIFEALRALDDHDEPRSLRFAGSGLPMWPFIRWLAMCAGQEAALGVANIGIAGHAASARQRIELLARSTLRGPLSTRRTFDHVMIATSAGTVLQREGRWFDRINDYFAMETAEQTLVLDMALGGAYKTPRFPPHVRCYDTFDIQAGVLARLVRPSDADLASIDRLVAFVRTRFPTPLAPATLDQIQTALVHWTVRLPILRRLWSRFFDRVQPRVLFIEGGSYGNFAHLCHWARERGITTAEFQHGLISKTHLAYNYGDAARADLAPSLPRYLLLYGEVWKYELRTPSESVVVGSPHFAETARPAEHLTDGATLTISQGYCTELMVRATETLARRFPDQRFIFRPHPGELPFREKYAPLANLPNVELAEGGDLYGLLAAARAVVGHSSTALLEAAGVGLPVFILDDELSRVTIPTNVGTWVKTIDELVAFAGSPATPTFKPDDFFARDWRERYHRFLASLQTAG